MNKLWLLLLLVIPYQSIHAHEVEHAPTVEQCTNDPIVWSNDLGVFSKLSIDELVGRTNEMGECAQIDLNHGQKYLSIASIYEAEISLRMNDFIHRHNLWEQFKAEDAQGKR